MPAQSAEATLENPNARTFMPRLDDSGRIVFGAALSTPRTVSLGEQGLKTYAKDAMPGSERDAEIGAKLAAVQAQAAPTPETRFQPAGPAMKPGM